MTYMGQVENRLYGEYPVIEWINPDWEIIYKQQNNKFINGVTH